MRCVHINIREATFLVLSIIINSIAITEMVDNKSVPNEIVASRDEHKQQQTANGEPMQPKDVFPTKSLVDLILACPINVECSSLPATCLDCDMKTSCLYGAPATIMCRPKEPVQCEGQHKFYRTFQCRFCYQTAAWEHRCDHKTSCNSAGSPRTTYATNCTVVPDVLCLGQRTFLKNVPCNWTRGYRWSTALLLSITLGGFGADRFYLGRWQEGLGKLFSFGGLGVWTLIDVVLVSLHYLGPADGSLYL